jgi:hypothetical protein
MGALALLLALSSCATTPSIDSDVVACRRPGEGIYVLSGLEDAGGRTLESTPTAYWVSAGDTGVRLEPLRWDSAAATWVPAPAAPAYLPAHSPCEAENARLALAASGDGLEITHKHEKLRAVYEPLR